MIHLKQNAAIVIDTMRCHLYRPNVVNVSIRCFSQLESFMKDSKIKTFTLPMAQQWCEEMTAVSSRGAFHQALLRLSDVYENGRVLSSHLSIHGDLSPEFSTKLDSFIFSLPPQDFIESSLERYREGIAMFFRFCQMHGVQSIAEISFDILEEYHTYINESGRSGFAAYEGCAERMLMFLAETRNIKYGYSLFLHYARAGKCLSSKDLNPEQKNKINAHGTGGSGISSGNYYHAVSSLVELLRSHGYSDNVVQGHFYRLNVLCIFLDREGLGYTREIANIWAEGLGATLFGKSKVTALYHTLDLFDDYLANKEHTVPKLIHAPRKSTYDDLPVWCRTQIDIYAETRKKEGIDENTVLKNTYTCAKFCRFLLTKGLNSFEEIRPEHIKSFNLQDQHRSIAGKNLTNQTIYRFLLYMEFHGVILNGLHDALPCSAQCEEKIVTVLSDEDKEKIDAYCSHAETPIQLRDAAILKLAESTALRGIDIIMLEKADIDWKNKYIKIVQSKTGIEHIHPVDTACLNAVFRYIRDGRPKGSPSERIFLSSRAPYAPVANSEVCREAMQRAGLTTAEFHRIRRSYATDSLKAGITFQETAELLGHSSTDTIHRYTLLDEDRIRLCPLSLEETGLKMDGRYHFE